MKDTIMIAIGIGADHHGYVYKEKLMRWAVQQYGHKIRLIDVGTTSSVCTDYPLYAHEIVSLIEKSVIDRAILLCGSGVGMCIAANRSPAVYAAVVDNPAMAIRVRQEDNINVLVLPADLIDIDMAQSIVIAWLATPFKRDQYQKRIAMIDAYRINK